MNVSEEKGFWKRLFFSLYNNPQPDDVIPKMWAQFKADNLQGPDVEKAIKKIMHGLQENVKKKLTVFLCENSRTNQSGSQSEPPQHNGDSGGNASVQPGDGPVEADTPLSQLETRAGSGDGQDVVLEPGAKPCLHHGEEKCSTKPKGECCQPESGVCASKFLYWAEGDSTFQDDFWHLMFTAIRDRESNPIGNDKKVPILEGGQIKDFTMADIEEKFASENPKLLTSQLCVPDQMIHDDQLDAHLNTDMVREHLKLMYDKNYLNAKDGFDQSTVKEQEKEKQAATQAREETKKSREANALQYRVAMKAEDYVQRTIKEALEDCGIPFYIFRGVNTYQDIGKFLTKFGIQMSKLKAIKAKDTKTTEECEHDIAILALLPSGPLVSFIQVVI